MKIDKQFIFSRFSRYPFIKIHHPLVTPIHKINLYSFYTPFGKSFKEFEIIVNGQPSQPKNNSHILLFSILYQFLKVESLIWNIRITSTLRPTFIKQNIVYSELRSKIYKILISIRITSGYKIHLRTIRCCSIPPFPGCKPRFNP